MSFSTVMIALAIISSGLTAGFFWGWGVSSIPGLARVSDRTYVDAMQTINRAILNPMFLLVFAGSVVILVLAAIAAFAAGDDRRGWWLTGSAVVYTFGVFGITAGGNVPLNNALDRFDTGRADDAAYATARKSYEGPWNRLHFVRSTLAVVALLFASIGALTSED